MTLFKKTLFAVLMMTLSLSSKAEWTHIGTSGSSMLDFYIDFKNVTFEGSYVKSKRLVDYHKEQKTEKGEIYWSSISIYTFDCVKKLQQVERIRYTERMGGGAHIEEIFFKSVWENVIEGTPNDIYMMKACAVRG